MDDEEAVTHVDRAVRRRRRVLGRLGIESLKGSVEVGTTVQRDDLFGLAIVGKGRVGSLCQSALSYLPCVPLRPELQLLHRSWMAEILFPCDPGQMAKDNVRQRQCSRQS